MFLAVEALLSSKGISVGQDAGFLARRLQDSSQAQMPPGSQYVIRIAWQLLFGAIYYMLIVTKYPELGNKVAPQASKDLQKLNAVSACFQTCPSWNCFHAFVCTGPRAAHTTDKVGVLPYWPALCLFSIIPCCTLCYTNACTDLNKKLGGDEQNVVMAMLCAFFCTACVITQDAESLDMCTGTRTGACGIEGGQGNN